MEIDERDILAVLLGKETAEMAPERDVSRREITVSCFRPYDCVGNFFRRGIGRKRGTFGTLVIKVIRTRKISFNSEDQHYFSPDAR